MMADARGRIPGYSPSSYILKYTECTVRLPSYKYLFKVLTEFMVQEGVSHVLESNSSVPQKTTIRIMLRIVPTKWLS